MPTDIKMARRASRPPSTETRAGRHLRRTHRLAEGLHHAGVLPVRPGYASAQDVRAQVLVVRSEVGGVDAPPGHEAAHHDAVAPLGPEHPAEARAVEGVHLRLVDHDVPVPDVQAVDEAVRVLHVRRHAAARPVHRDEHQRLTGVPEHGDRRVHRRNDGAGRDAESPACELVLHVHDDKREDPVADICVRDHLTEGSYSVMSLEASSIISMKSRRRSSPNLSRRASETSFR